MLLLLGPQSTALLMHGADSFAVTNTSPPAMREACVTATAACILAKPKSSNKLSAGRKIAAVHRLVQLNLDYERK